MLLEVVEINTYYHLSHILFGVSLEVPPGKTVCLLGRNGVGKTTIMRSIIGLTPPRSGRIEIFGKDIKGKQPFEIARMGVGYVPEGRIIFPDLTVIENLEIAVIKRNNVQDWTLEKVFDVFPKLRERRKQMGGTLSGGEQQMLTMARTLMGNPKVLLLDEPTEGLSPIMVKAVEEQIYLLKKEGVTILISEQNSNIALKISDYVYFVEKGKIIWHGNASVLKEKPELMKQYLGI